MKKNMILAGLAGGVVGVASALLFTSKSGSQLIQTMYTPFAPPISDPLPKIKKNSKKTRATAVSVVHHPKKEKPKSHVVEKNKPATKRSVAKKKSNHTSTEAKNQHT